MPKSPLRLFMCFILLLIVSFQVQAANIADIDLLILTKKEEAIKEAIQRLEQELDVTPQNGELLWFMAKAKLYLGDQMENKLSIYEEGKTYADAAVEQSPNSPHSHYWQSVLIGRIGQTRGVLSSLSMVRPMKNALERVLDLDPDYADAHWVLSQLYQEAPGFPLSIGNKKLALEHAQKAVELDPLNLEYQLQLINALEHNGQKDAALELLTTFLKNPELLKEPTIKSQAETLLHKLNR